MTDKRRQKPIARSAARLGAVQALYQMDIGGTDVGETLAQFSSRVIGDDFDDGQCGEADYRHLKDVVDGVVREQSTIDPSVDRILDKSWPLHRLDATVRAILRAGAYELMFMEQGARARCHQRICRRGVGLLRGRRAELRQWRAGPAGARPQAGGIRSVTAAETFDDHKARRNAVILAIAQALYGATLTALVVTSGLVGTQLAPDPSWATMPMSMTIVGTALTTFPISLMMKRIGRRAGFMICAMLGALGSLLGTYAIFQRSFGLFLAGSLMLGIYQASASYYRFAAADLASPQFRPKAISWVMTGGVAAALFGTRACHGHRRPPGADHLRRDMGGDGAARADRRRAADGGGHSLQGGSRCPNGPAAAGDRPAAALHRGGRDRHTGLWHHDAGDDGNACRHARLRLHGAGFKLGDPVACACPCSCRASLPEA